MDNAQRSETPEEKQERLEKFLEAFEALLRPGIRDIVAAVRQGLDSPDWSVEVPDPDTVDLSIQELGSIVARTSNHYGRMARIAGMARAQLKIADAKYKRVFKQSKHGRNEDEREASAMHTAAPEQIDLSIIEAAVEIADGLERAARVASESSRKIYDRVIAQETAQRRQGSVSP